MKSVVPHLAACGARPRGNQPPPQAICGRHLGLREFSFGSFLRGTFLSVASVQLAGNSQQARRRRRRRNDIFQSFTAAVSVVKKKIYITKQKNPHRVKKKERKKRKDASEIFSDCVSCSHLMFGNDFTTPAGHRLSGRSGVSIG